MAESMGLSSPTPTGGKWNMPYFREPKWKRDQDKVVVVNEGGEKKEESSESSETQSGTATQSQEADAKKAAALDPDSPGLDPDATGFPTPRPEQEKSASGRGRKRRWFGKKEPEAAPAPSTTPFQEPAKPEPSDWMQRMAKSDPFEEHRQSAGDSASGSSPEARWAAAMQGLGKNPESDSTSESEPAAAAADAPPADPNKPFSNPLDSGDEVGPQKLTKRQKQTKKRRDLPFSAQDEPESTPAPELKAQSSTEAGFSDQSAPPKAAGKQSSTPASSDPFAISPETKAHYALGNKGTPQPLASLSESEGARQSAAGTQQQNSGSASKLRADVTVDLVSRARSGKGVDPETGLTPSPSQPQGAPGPMERFFQDRFQERNGAGTGLRREPGKTQRTDDFDATDRKRYR